MFRPAWTTAVLLVFLAHSWSPALALQQSGLGDSSLPTTKAEATLPDEPPAPHQDQSKSVAGSLGTAAKMIGEDELHIIKTPFSLSALKWNAVVIGATGILIANDESVLHQVPASWHVTSINISDAGVYGLGVAAGGIVVTGLLTHNDHATNTGIRSAEASVDSVLLYAALKAVFARQRPYSVSAKADSSQATGPTALFPQVMRLSPGRSLRSWHTSTRTGRCGCSCMAWQRRSAQPV